MQVLLSCFCYTSILQRACAILLMAVFSISLIAPALTLEPEAKLPACCRRDGKHGCAMLKSRSSEQSGRPILKGRVHCESYPTGNAIPAAAKVIIAQPVHRIGPSCVCDAQLIAPVQVPHRRSMPRAWRQRGPPVDPQV